MANTSNVKVSTEVLEQYKGTLTDFAGRVDQIIQVVDDFAQNAVGEGTCWSGDAATSFKTSLEGVSKDIKQLKDEFIENAKKSADNANTEFNDTENKAQAAATNE